MKFLCNMYLSINIDLSATKSNTKCVYASPLLRRRGGVNIMYLFTSSGNYSPAEHTEYC